MDNVFTFRCDDELAEVIRTLIKNFNFTSEGIREVFKFLLLPMKNIVLEKKDLRYVKLIILISRAIDVLAKENDAELALKKDDIGSYTLCKKIEFLKELFDSLAQGVVTSETFDFDPKAEEKLISLVDCMIKTLLNTKDKKSKYEELFRWIRRAK